MLVNICSTQYEAIMPEGVLDCRTLQGTNTIVAAILHNPVLTRTERVALFTKTAQALSIATGKTVYVTADLDIYCRLGKESCDFVAVQDELIRRGSVCVVSEVR